LHKVGDEGQVHDVDGVLGEWDAGEVDFGLPEEGEGYEGEEGWVGGQLEAEADGADDAMELDPDG
jgi:hypothetical protein